MASRYKEYRDALAQAAEAPQISLGSSAMQAADALFSQAGALANSSSGSKYGLEDLKGMIGNLPEVAKLAEVERLKLNKANPNTTYTGKNNNLSFGDDIGVVIEAAANKYGVPPAIMKAIAQIESSGNPNAKNPNSSAGGLFQFIDSTAKNYGLTNKYDPVQAADAGARLAKDNINYLSKKLGRDLTPGEIYMAHQQGVGGAYKILSNPNANAIELLGEEQVKLNGGNASMTAAEFANLWSNKINKYLG